MARPYAPVPYASKNAGLADLIRQRGATAADMELRRGDARAAMWGGIGRTVGGTLSALAQDRQEAPIRAQETEARTIGLDNARAAQAASRKATEDAGVLSSAMSSRLGPDEVKAQLQQLGRGDLVPVFEQTWTGLEQSRLGLKETQTKLSALQADYFGAMAAGIKAAGYEPFAVEWALREAAADGHDVSQIKAALTQNPASVRPMVDRLIAQSPTQVKLVGEESDRALRRDAEARALEAAKQAQADREADNARAADIAAETARHNKAMESRPVAGAQPTFQAREVLNDDGVAVTANYNARTGETVDVSTGRVIKNPRPVPTAAASQDARKFKQAAPVIAAVAQLSERINTQQGLIATMSGGVEKVKAQANYNDDIAEYQSIIDAFAPFVARALGHTGFLTQMDVDSAKAMFPKPVDSKSLRDRKTVRLNQLVADIQATMGEGAATSAAPETPEQRAKRLYDELTK